MSTKFSNWQGKKDKTSMKFSSCVTGIFQLFDRQHLLSRRRLSGQEHKKNNSCLAKLSLGKEEADHGESCNSDTNLSSSYQENCSSCMESSPSRTPFSSSKSFSSKSRQDEPRCSKQSFSSGRQPTKTSNPRSSDMKQSPGLRDISIKEPDRKTNKVLKPVDSPRPVVDLSTLKGLEESLRILIKLKELPEDFHGVSGSPRYSCDGRETLQAPADIRHAFKHKEHRRLSLDSMEDSRLHDFNSKFNSLVKELKGNTNRREREASSLLQDHESNENYPNIVAKLMGLEPVSPVRINNIKGYDKESKQGKSLQSPTNSPKFQRSIKQHTKFNSNSSFAIEGVQQKTFSSVEGGMNQKTESVCSVKEKTLQKLHFQNNSKETRRKTDGDWKFKFMESSSLHFTQPTSNMSGKTSFSARDLKSSTIVIKPASKSAVASSSQFVKLEGPAGLRRIRTCDSSSGKNESGAVHGEQSPTGRAATSLMKSSCKGTGRRAGNRTGSPDLQKKSGAMISSYNMKKGQRQQSETESPRCRVKEKPCKEQDKDGNSTPRKGKTDAKTASASKHDQLEMIPREVLYAKELEKVVLPLSSPNSVLSLYTDDLPLSPLSASSISKADGYLPSDHNLERMHHPSTLESNHRFRADAQKSETGDTIPQQLLLLRATTDESPMSNEIILMLENHSPDDKYVAELLLETGILSKGPHTPAMINKIKQVEPSETVEKSKSRMLHRQLVRDVVREILAEKKETFDRGLLEPDRLSAQLLFSELCLEMHCLQSRRHEAQDKDSPFATDFLRRSKAWDRFESEVPVVASEIESLIFADLIKEIVSSVSPVVLRSKGRNRMQLVA